MKVLRSKNNYLVYYCIFFLCVLIFGLSQFPSSDDFCHLLEARENGSLEYGKEAYFNWSGRVLIHIIIGFLFNLFDIDKIYFVSAINYSLFFVASILITKIISIETKDIDDKSQFRNWIAITFTISIGMREALSQIVSWPTGGLAYILPFTFFFLTIWILNRNSAGTILEFICVVLCCFFLEPLNPALFVAVALKYFYPFKRKEKNPYPWILIFSIAAVSLIFYLAPGNFARANQNKSQIIDVSFLLKAVGNYLYLLYKTLRYFWISGFIAAVCGSIIGSKRIYSIKIFNKIPADTFFFLCALASLTPFVIAKDFYNMRASSFIVIQLTIATFTHFLRKSTKYFPPIYITYQQQIIWTLYIVLCGSFVLDSFRVFDVRQALYQRHEILKLEAGNVVEVKSYKQEIKKISASHLDDITSNPDHWINKCVSRYYSLESIKSK